MKNIILIILTFFLTSKILIGQSFKTCKELNISGKLKVLVNDIAKDGTLKSSAVGYAGSKPEQYSRFEDLCKISTINQLRILSNHKSPAVRAYSSWALLKKNDSYLYNIGINHINDTATVNTLFGCIGGVEQIGDFILGNTYEYLTMHNEEKKIRSLDSILLFQKNSSGFKNRIIANISPRDYHLYPRIRELAEVGNKAAIITLSKFKNESDIPLIKKLYKKEKFLVIRAVNFFPHPDFIPILEKYSEEAISHNGGFKSEWRYFYKTISSYKNEWANEILNKPLQKVKNSNIQKYYVDFVFEAVSENLDQHYQGLVYKLWNNWQKSDLRTIKYLIKSRRNDKENIIFNTFQNSENFSGFEYGIDAELLEYLVKQSFEIDKTRALAIIEEKISNCNVHFISFYSKYIKLGNPRIIEASLSRLKKEWNAHVYLELTRKLISLNNENVNDQILKIYKKNRELKKGWGGKEMKQLIKKIK